MHRPLKATPKGLRVRIPWGHLNDGVAQFKSVHFRVLPLEAVDVGENPATITIDLWCNWQHI